MERLIAYFSGQVQGVGFRYTVASLARGRTTVSGTVRNLPDGRVELIAEGPMDDLRAFLEEIRADMEGYVRSVDTRYVPATGEFNGFRIAF